MSSWFADQRASLFGLQVCPRIFRWTRKLREGHFDRSPLSIFHWIHNSWTRKVFISANNQAHAAKPTELLYHLVAAGDPKGLPWACQFRRTDSARWLGTKFCGFAQELCDVCSCESIGLVSDGRLAEGICWWRFPSSCGLSQSSYLSNLSSL